MRSVSILATGSELLDGRVVDTNSNFVAKELSERGLKLKRVLVVDDDMSELVQGLRELSTVSDFIITSGGLGPTSDDLTRDMVAAFFGVGLAEHPDAVAHLEGFFAKRGRVLDSQNRRQAFLPIGSQMIPNPNGTAPGFVMKKDAGATVVSLSGVPREFKPMFLDTVMPMIEASRGGVEAIQRATMKTFGLPESTVGRLIEGLELPKEIVVSYRAAFPEVHVVLKAPQSFELAPSIAAARAALRPETIFSEEPGDSFLISLQKLLISKRLTVSTAESCTGGMVSELLTRTPGSSAVFLGGVVAYSNDIKERVVGVSGETLESHGAVSAETVRELARNVRERFKTSYGVSISGIAGPDGGTESKPVGTFYVGVSSEAGSFEMKCLYVSERQNVRSYASYVALDLVRRAILGLPVPEGYPIFR
jgi:nicotinamide-nucleotide amidase